MLVVAFAMVLVVGLPADPSALVEQLGGARFVEREAAEARLNELGRLALPALRVGRTDGNPEVKLRATALLSRIEQNLLVQPTMITLDFQHVSTIEAIQVVSRQSGLRVMFDPNSRSGLATRPLSLRTANPLPFWQAVDRLCESGRLHYALGAQSPTGQADGSFVLFDGPARSPSPTSDSGPFRVHLTGIQQMSEVMLTQPRATLGGRDLMPLPPNPVDQMTGRPTTSKPFFLQLVVAGEPGLSVTQNGAVVLSQAVDDQGHSLVMPTGRSMISHSSGYFGMNPSPLVRLRVDLASPGEPVKRIKKLKGTIPVIVASRRANPLELPLGGSSGKPITVDDGSLTVVGVQAGQGGLPSTIEVTLKTKSGSPTIRDLDGDLMAQRPEAPQQQLEILDAQRRAIPWFPTRMRYSEGEVQMTLTVTPQGGAQMPSLIRYHGIIQTATEIPFEFRDVPMP